jgi:peptidoglycan-N-acetylglucosamine deacetylase
MMKRTLFAFVALRLAPLAALSALAAGSLCAFAADATAPVAPPHRLEKGGVVLTFDDRNFSGWLNTLPLLDKYGARATFFVSGVIDRQALDALGQLQSHGHAIGAHGLKHLGAVEYCRQHSPEEYVRSEIRPQLEPLKAAGITPTSFA